MLAIQLIVIKNMNEKKKVARGHRGEKGLRNPIEPMDKVPANLSQMAWDLYCRAFAETSEKTPRPQPLGEEQFMNLMNDPKFKKFFSMQGTEPAGMLILASDMRDVGFWISIPYLEQELPEELENDGLYYVAGVLTDPSVRKQPIRHFVSLMENMIEFVIKENRQLLMDYSPQSAPNYAELVERYYGNKWGNSAIEYIDLDRQLHGSIEIENVIEESALNPKTEALDEVKDSVMIEALRKLYEKRYAEIEKKSVQPQALSQEAFEAALKDPDYIKLIDKDDSDNIQGFVLVSRKVEKPEHMLNPAFMSEKHGDDLQLFNVCGFAGSEQGIENCIRKLCPMVQQHEGVLYFVGSEKGMAEELEAIKKVAGGEFNYDGSQDYGLFKHSPADEQE